MKTCLRIAIACMFLAGSCVFAGPGKDDGEKPKKAPREDSPEFGPPGQATLTPNGECVVASELMGDWKLDWARTREILGKDPFFKAEELHFTEDRQAANRILRDLTTWHTALLADGSQADSARRLGRAMQTIYLAGNLRKGTTYLPDHDFALTVLNGNPYLMVHAGDGFFYECSSVMLARDVDGDNDLLFLGGPGNDESFIVYHRAKKKEPKQEE